MSVDLFVVRGDGLKRGADIENALVSFNFVALELGSNVLDENSKFSVITLSSLYRKNVRVGNTVRVLDSLQGQAWVGKIVEVSIFRQNQSDTLSLEIRVRKPE